MRATLIFFLLVALGCDSRQAALDRYHAEKQRLAELEPAYNSAASAATLQLLKEAGIPDFRNKKIDPDTFDLKVDLAESKKNVDAMNKLTRALKTPGTPESKKFESLLTNNPDFIAYRNQKQRVDEAERKLNE